MKLLKIFVYILALHFTQFLFSQAAIHHSMIGSQGANAELANGYAVYQSVGQQTVTNTGTAKDFVQQGFQQSYWKSIIAQNKDLSTTQIYPNPFKDIISIKFSKSPGKTVACNIYDLQGRLIFSERLENTNNLIKLDLRKLINTQYLIRIIGDNLVYSKMIIKE
jgi:hypothetical protein